MQKVALASSRNTNFELHTIILNIVSDIAPYRVAILRKSRRHNLINIKVSHVPLSFRILEAYPTLSLINMVTTKHRDTKGYGICVKTHNPPPPQKQL